ncbi:MAG: hypothetical protein LQ351_000333 [Letrouitia transgressa]|nr:MAG: hypothetical protein LQ351_000333 [Letrouitia transgressa]
MYVHKHPVTEVAHTEQPLLIIFRSGRRNTENRIRGPQSALTDFLASNNISAAQISADYERRRRQAQQNLEREVAANREAPNGEEQDVPEETELQKKKRKRKEEKVLAKIKESKEFNKQKKKKGKHDDDDSGPMWDMYAKSAPMPGQLENCEACQKRFTVTAYSKEGPGGGLLCTKCSKEQETQRKKDAKPKKQAGPRERQRQARSNLLDGLVQNGSPSLLEMCIKQVADNIQDVDEFGDLPHKLLNRLSQILSKRRVITSRTMNLFLTPGLETIDLYDCGKLESQDFIKIFSVVPTVQNLNLGNAGQFKDEVLDYIMERDVPIKNLRLEAANLVSDAKWIEYFKKCGHRLESLKLSWLDSSMDDDTFIHVVRDCPNLKQLKLKKCFRLGDGAVEAIAELKQLERISLQLPGASSAPVVVDLIHKTGQNLKTLSLEGFDFADDKVLAAIHSSCTRLEKFRFCENDYCTDRGFSTLFNGWSNPPLVFLNLAANRSIDNADPDGPEDPIGVATAGFKALMAHSSSQLEKLDISSCRHIERETFESIFDGKMEYTNLRELNISFLTKIDTTIVVGIFRSCPRLTKLTAFGCFNVTDVTVPKGVALIGLPNAQDSIIREGKYDADWPRAHL